MSGAPEEAVRQQAEPHGIDVDITQLTIHDLNQRSVMGKEKYGEVLRPFNGRDALTDAYQEVLDLAVYFRQLIYERNELINRINIHNEQCKSHDCHVNELIKMPGKED